MPSMCLYKESQGSHRESQPCLYMYLKESQLQYSVPMQ